MIDLSRPHLTKSDYLLYCESPRHLWAKKNNRIEHTLSDFDQHLIAEGYEVEKLAQDYFVKLILPQKPGYQMKLQQTFIDGLFEARVDILLFNPEESSYEIYEVKSSTSPDKKDLNDIAFQFLILHNQVNIEKAFIVHLNKDYVRAGELDLAQLFIVEELTEIVRELLPEIDGLRHEALLTLGCKDPNELPHCLAPKDCPCPDICHPNLPEFSIYDVPRLSQKKKAELLDMGIRDAKEIPVTFNLNDKQLLIVERARTNSEYLDQHSLNIELQKLQFPLWFLDYETCISAIPRFNGYHPQQQIVFQYSLHQLDRPEGNLEHYGCIATTDGDLSQLLLEHLVSDLGNTGSVIVWNKAFEMTMNREMAKLYPEYSEFLTNLNERIYDLGEIVNRGIYLHPQFKGSWSIKHVLPVMIPELSYDEMIINKGDKASMAWWKIAFEEVTKEEKDHLLEGLDKYCELDTLAMVEIYKKLAAMA